MGKITADKVLYIKLGEGGQWANECLTKKQTLRLGYSDVDHNDCMNKNWNKVHNYLLQAHNNNRKTATGHLTQLRYFYEGDKNTLWITFDADKMWWGFADKNIDLLGDGTKERKIKWSDKDIKGKLLQVDDLSGLLLQKHSFRGTICSADNVKQYVLNKINAVIDPSVLKAKELLDNGRESIEPLIKALNPDAFELLVDLVFRQIGWQRTSRIGGNQKAKDFTLINPFLNKTALVQVKSRTSYDECMDYVNIFKDMPQYAYFYYVSHSPDVKLLKRKGAITNEFNKINLWFSDDISEMVVRTGLTDWLLRKNS